MTGSANITQFQAEGIASINERLIRSTLEGCDRAAGRLNLGPEPVVRPLVKGTAQALAKLKSPDLQSLDDTPESRVVLAAIIILEMHRVVFFTLHKPGNRQLLRDAFSIASEASPGIQMPSWMATVLSEPVITRPDSLDFRA